MDPKVQKTKGWAALMEQRKTKRQRQIEAETGVKQSKLSLIENLLSKPSLEEGFLLAKIGIDPALWTQPLEKPRKKARRAA